MSNPILIAECCQNHNGDREVLKKQIHQAAENGADFVKMQTMRSSELTHRQRFDDGDNQKVINRPFEAEFARLKKLDLTLDDEEWFVMECVRAGVGSMTTCFTRAGCRDVCQMGYEAVKVASYDCPSFPLLRDLAKHWRRIVVSTGACFDHEIIKAAKVLESVELTLLHCVTIYPTPLEEMHLNRMQWLRQFAPRVGLSDHSHVKKDGVWGSKIALAIGADCIERHFTVLDDDQTRDGPVSITPSLLQELRRFADLPRYERMAEIRSQFPEWENALGSPTRPLSHPELLNRDYYRGRFATKQNGEDVYNWEEIDLD